MKSLGDTYGVVFTVGDVTGYSAYYVEIPYSPPDVDKNFRDPVLLVGGIRSVSLDAFNNQPAVAYTGQYYHLTFSYKDSAGWHPEVVDLSCTATDVSMVVYENIPYISYCDNTGLLKITHRIPSGTWITEVVDNTGFLGDTRGSISLAFDLGQPRIAYRDETTHALRYAWRDAAGTWHPMTIDSGSPGQYPNYIGLAFDRTHKPHIIYNKDASTTRHFFDDGTWHIEDLPEFCQSPSLAIPSAGWDTPQITYTKRYTDSLGMWNQLKYGYRGTDSAWHTYGIDYGRQADTESSFIIDMNTGIRCYAFTSTFNDPTEIEWEPLRIYVYGDQARHPLMQPRPSLESISPGTKVAGDPPFSLIVTGHDFVPDSTVLINPYDSPGPYYELLTTYISPTRLTAAVDSYSIAYPREAHIAVSTGNPGGGLSDVLPLIVQPAPLALNSLDPSSVRVGSAGFTLTARGTGFHMDSGIQWDGVSIPTISYPGMLTADIPASSLTTAGGAQVRVSNPGSPAVYSNELTFVIDNPVPVITSIDPSVATTGDADGFVLTVIGSGFFQTSPVLKSHIMWNGGTLATTYNGPGSLSATIPASYLTTPGSAEIKVNNPGPWGGSGTDSNTVYLTIVSGKSLALVSPNGGEEWTQGSVRTISWGYKGNMGPSVKIVLLKSGVPDHTIIQHAPIGTGGAGSYSWTVPPGQAAGTDYRIRVMCAGDPTYTDESASDFTIMSQPWIRVTSPNGGENWTPGSTHPVTWDYNADPGATVNISLVRYYQNPQGGTAAVYYPVASFVPTGSGGSGSCSLTIPSNQYPGTQYKIDVRSTTNSAYSDQSDNYLTIGPRSIVVTEPVQGVNWTQGQPCRIEWTYTGSTGPDVEIALLKEESFHAWINTSTPAGVGGSGSYAWEVPSYLPVGDDYRVRVTDSAHPECSGRSGLFSVVSPPQIVLVSPGTGEDWAQGSTHQIQWTYSGTITTDVDISLYKNGSYVRTLTTLPYILHGAGSYDWTIPEAEPAGTDYRITIVAETEGIDGRSDIFAIHAMSGNSITVTAPNGSDYLITGYEFDIAWDYSGSAPGDTVTIELLYSGAPVQEIATTLPINNSSTAGHGVYHWYVPRATDVGSLYQVRITTNTHYMDMSDNYFTISTGPLIAVTSPAGGENWLQGSTHTITWSYAADPGSTVTIDLLKGGVFQVPSIIASTPIGTDGTGSYSWTIPADQETGSDYRIRLRSNTFVFNSGGADFAISAPGPESITVLSPNGGDTWMQGSTQPITWSYTGNPGSAVQIELVKDGVVQVPAITSGTPTGSGGSGSYAWSIPASQAMGSGYRVRVTSTSIPTVNDTGNADFAITGIISDGITVISPDGGENWVQGSTQPITWSYTGNPGTTVLIELVKDGVIQVPAIISGTSMGSGGLGSYSWNIPAGLAAGSGYQIRVTSTSYPALDDMSDANFTIGAAVIDNITVMSPNGGEKWARGSSHKIRWNYTGGPGPKVKIELLKPGSAGRIITRSTSTGSGGTGVYPWTVPSGLTPGKQYRVRVTSTKNGTSDVSDNTFRIA